jgi:excisionase family DNA binding protein
MQTNARELVDTEEAAARLSVAASTLVKWRKEGVGPRFVRVGRLVRYRGVDLEQYLVAATVATRSQHGLSTG